MHDSNFYIQVYTTIEMAKNLPKSKTNADVNTYDKIKRSDRNLKKSSLLYMVGGILIAFTFFVLLGGCNSNKQSKIQFWAYFPDKIEIIKVGHLQGTFEKMDA